MQENGKIPQAGVEGNWVAVRLSDEGWRVVGFNKVW